MGVAAVGYSTNDFWNGFQFSGVTNATLTNFVWSDESSSSAGVTVSNAPGIGSNPVSDGMFDSYKYGISNNIKIVLTNVTSGIYDFFLYGHGASNTQNGIFQLSSGTNSYGTRSTTTVGANSWISAAWQEGIQYVVFRNISVSSGQPVTLTVEEDGAGYAVINGLQLAPDNPATTIYSLINIDLGYSPTNEVGPAAVGLTDDDGWNNVSGVGDTAPYGMSDLEYPDGTDSGVGITVTNAPGDWGNPVSDPMYSSYIYQWDDNPVVLAVTNLPYGRYDFYLYGHGAADDQISTFDLSVGGVDYGTYSTAPTSNAWNSIAWQEGSQYVVFRDVWVDNGQIVNITVEVDDAGYAIVNGMQIVQPMQSIPDPPFIVTQPQSQTNTVGQTAMMSVSAIGGPLYYQWYFDSGAISGATQSTLLLTDVQFDQAGTYYVTVTNTVGSATSSNAVLTVLQPECFPAPTNLVSWWQAESDMSDSTGGNDGTAVGSVGYTTGMVGTAFSFDGDSSGDGEAVFVGSASNLQLQNFTVDAWIQRGDPGQASLDAGGGLVFSFGDQGYGFGLNDNGQLFLSQIDDSEVVSSLLVTDTGWHHVAVTMTNNTVVFYVDGVADSSQTYDVTFSFSSPAAAVGARGDNSFNVFLGALDEVNVFSRALSGDEIAGIYNASILGKCYGSSPSITTQPSSYTKCVGDTVTFSVTATGSAPLLYEWLKNSAVIAGATGSAYTNSSVGTNDSGTYTVIVANRGGEVTSSNATLTVNARPTASVSGSSAICNGGSATIEATLTGTGPWTIVWSDGATNTPSSSPATRTVSPTSSTTYTVSSLSDANCNSDSGDLTGSATITVHSRPTAVVSGSTAIPSGATTSISATLTGTGPWTIVWSDGTTNTPSSSPATYNVSPITTTTYTITRLSDANCTSDGGDLTGNATIDVYTDIAALTLVSGAEQSGLPNALLAQPLLVPSHGWLCKRSCGCADRFFRDAWGSPICATSNGTFVSSLTISSDSSGNAQVYVTLPSDAGTTSLIAASCTIGVTNSAQVTFTALCAFGITEIGAGINSFSGLLKTGGVTAAGGDGSGQFGDFTYLDDAAAVQSVNLTNIAEIAKGYWHSLALESNGVLWGWGDNTDGQLGLVGVESTNIPTVLMTNVAGIAAGYYQSIAIQSNGTVWAWGTYVHGLGGSSSIKLGYGYGSGDDTAGTLALVPTQVGTISNAVAVAAGGSHGLALLSDSTVIAWGWNDNGQLGDPTAEDFAPDPVAVDSLTGVTGITPV